MAMKTPGVYIVEKSAFPNSVVQVATAVPAFIGYTERAVNGTVSLDMTPWRITSFSEFVQYYGGAPDPVFEIVDFEVASGVSPLSADGAAMKDPLPRAVFPLGEKKFELKQKNPAFSLYGAMRLFFQNGGGPCYVISIGAYKVRDDQGQLVDNVIDAEKMLTAIDSLKNEPEPTMLVIPEATRLVRQNCVKVQQAMLKHCGNDMKNRFAILDIFGGHLGQKDPLGNPVATFRNDVGINNLDFGAAYFPWLDTSIFQSRDFSFQNIEPASHPKMMALLKQSVKRNPDLAPEIDRISAPTVTGDFTISVTKGGKVAITEQDLKAEDDESDKAGLTYALAKKPGTLAGSFVKTEDDSEIKTFTQEDVSEGKVSFKHDDATPEGKFEMTVTDELGISTDTITLKVEVVGGVLAKADIEAETAVSVDVAADNPEGDADSVVLVEATSSDGKTKALDGVGTWKADAGTVTFTPDPAFAGPEAKVKYTIFKDDAPLATREIRVLVDGTTPVRQETPTPAAIDKTLRALVPLYVTMMDAIARRENAMPPAAAMAGIYTMVDNARGVWKAPANVSLNSVVAPRVNINHEEQENLNVSTTGKSINAIRPFVGEGTLVWGARTLDGNSLDWRYINVRRTMIMIEESIRLASKAYVFEPNTANTWVTMRSMIENFLTSVWKAGGLAGAVPTDAFSVFVGLGETMTPEDILEGILRITVLVAVTRPAEFIEITFQQQMQKS
ncbi:cadherin-like domain-containing protein [Rhodovulum kholense]|uniref:Tail sheath protein C-terminal domain-containing protein n=1 Tax=Rhodovulum kholense TaxID=453584 RepID=A0A8E2VNZ7_9RHOB|nr:cadherin-like domain-containing protein [Rhodovulum kholense]PTW52183.1 hypothetical protein C8N38_101488 [Rhodovulum kholense]